MCPSVLFIGVKTTPAGDVRHLGQRWRTSSPGMYAILPDDRADLFPCAFLLVDVRINHGGGELAAVGVKKSLVKIVHNFIFRLFWIIFAWFSR